MNGRVIFVSLAMLCGCDRQTDPAPRPVTSPAPVADAEPDVPSPARSDQPTSRPMWSLVGLARRATGRAHERASQSIEAIYVWQVPARPEALSKLAKGKRGTAVWRGSRVKLELRGKQLLEFEAANSCLAPAEEPPWATPAGHRTQKIEPIWWVFDGASPNERVGLRLDTHFPTIWTWNADRKCMTGQRYAPELAKGVVRTSEWPRAPEGFEWRDADAVESYRWDRRVVPVEKRSRAVADTRVALGLDAWRVTTGGVVVEITPRRSLDKMGCVQAEARLLAQGSSRLVDLRARYGEHDCLDVAMHAAELVQIGADGPRVLVSKHDELETGVGSYNKTVYDRSTTFGALRSELKGTAKSLLGAGECDVPTVDDEGLEPPYCADEETMEFTTEWRAELGGKTVRLGTARLYELTVTCGWCGK